MQEILDQIKNYADLNLSSSSKKWEAGKDWVQYAGPYFDHNEFVAATKTLLGGWLVLGEDGLRFERMFPNFLGKEHGILTNSGSSSNLLMMSAMASKRLHGFPKGTKVITPIAGFPTTINPIFQVGFEPFFVDIELDTLNLNLDQIQAGIDAGAKIITFAHVLGNPPNMNKLMKIIKDNSLVLLEDCCDALGSSYDGKLLGSFGEYSSCSFYPAHHITMGEGGFVACETRLQEIVARSFREWGRGCYCTGKKANLLKNGTCNKRFHNWLPSIPEEIFDHKYVYDEIGYNLKPIELQASIGLAQLNKLPEIIRKRKENHAQLVASFKPFEEFFYLPKATDKADPSWFAFAVTIKDNAPFKRREIVDFFESAKIQTRPYFAGNIMLQPAYDGLMDKESVIKNYPVARKITSDTFFLGTSPVISSEQISYIKEKLESFMSKI